MPKLVLRVEAEGRLLGEFPLEAGPLTLRLQEAGSGRVISTTTYSGGDPGAEAPADGPPVGADLYRDETVDLSPAMAASLRLELPSPGGEGAVQEVHGAVFAAAAEEEPEVIEASESLDAGLPSDASMPPPAPAGEEPPAVPEDEDAGEEFEGTETRGTALPAVPAPPRPELDRSVTHALPDTTYDLLQAAGLGLLEGPPTHTDPIPEDDSSQATLVERPVPDAVSLLDAGRPTTGGPDRESSSVSFLAPDDPSAAVGGYGRLSAGPTIIPSDFAEEDEAVTVVAQQPGAEHGDGRGAPGHGEYDELPVHGHRTLAPVDDDLSLSLPYDPGKTDASIPELSLGTSPLEFSSSDLDHSLSLPLPDGNLYGPSDDDDLSLPMPEGLVVEPPERSSAGDLLAASLGRPHAVTPRLDTTGGFERDPSTERLEGAEVWFRRGGEWTPRGALSLGQHVQAFGGMVRCDDSGGLVVLAGPRLHGSATLPSGELRQVQSGQQAVQLPPGTSVILWQGEQGIYVRSNVPADVSGPLMAPEPAAQPRTTRSRSWKPPRSDLEDERS
ncbi:MAG: hypothetical protein ABIO70_36965 [Pseudomonadota bacterium]